MTSHHPEEHTTTMTTVHCSDLKIGDEIAGRTIVKLTKGHRIIGIEFDDGTDAGFDRDDLGANLVVSNR
jgi:hypothetical protein